jgi:UDP-N-acetylmuramoylalanine--D-glutamate ligase
MNVNNKKILIIGMGKSGIAASEALLSLGARVSIYDGKSTDEIEHHMIQYFKNRDANCFLGQEPLRVDDFDFAVVSPGVPLDNNLVRRVVEAGVELLGEVELAYRIGKGTYVAITGTNGKTTTTVLTGEIFRKAGISTEIVGNIGLAAVKKAVRSTDDTWLVTEISSFQLETTKEFHPHISALLNITPDHLDRHGRLENYINAKALVYKNQNEKDYFVVNREDETCWDLAKKCPAKVVPFSRIRKLDFGAWIKDGSIVITGNDGKDNHICKVEDVGLLGTHNLENVLAASTIAFFAGIDGDVIGKAVTSFQGVAHRLEFAGEVQGVRFINDSKGTNTDASTKAIQAVNSPIVLIAGGYDKDSSFDDFIDSFEEKVKALVLLGKTAAKIKETAEKKGFVNILMAKNMEECVRIAFQQAMPGDTVLLSPACASWDMYLNFEQRGDHFKSCVKDLAK